MKKLDIAPPRIAFDIKRLWRLLLLCVLALRAPSGALAQAAPEPPTNLQAGSGWRQITLTWTASTSPEVTHYSVHRATQSGGQYDCYVMRVRHHHRQTSLADQYDLNGFHSPDHVLSVDVTEKNGDGSNKVQFEYYYVPKGEAPPGINDVPVTPLEDMPQ